LPHTLDLKIKVGGNAIRWTYTVDNRQGNKPVPFGFALHPWFLYQGARKDTYVTIPATHLMDAEKLLPTGKLLDLASEPDYDARQPRSLEGFLRDDVYYGMQPSKPAVIDFRGPKLKVTLSASEEFTHLVLYTPKDQPWFCVENQTCSTDAHNLFARGLKKESHLQIVEPGKTATGWVEYRFESY
jgi:aldose 1-epimerase